MKPFEVVVVMLLLVIAWLLWSSRPKRIRINESKPKVDITKERLAEIIRRRSL